MPMNKKLSEHYQALLTASGDVMKQALANAGQAASVLQLADDLETIGKLIKPAPEHYVVLNASRELQISALALFSGLYRPAFGSLRLSLELMLGALHFSAHRLELAEWMNGKKDLNWSSLVDTDNGVLSIRFADAFFPELRDDVSKYNGTVRKVYRDLSEFVHGNVHTWKLTPAHLNFNKELHDRWCRHLKSIAEVAFFGFSLRYLKEVDPKNLTHLEAPVIERLGHIETIRHHFTKPTK